MAFSVSCLVLMTFIGLACCSSDEQNAPNPIIIITGFGGSRLSVQDTSEGECNTNGGNVTLWRNAEYVATSPQCFLDQFRLDYDNGSYVDPPNVKVFVPNFGSLDSLADFSDLFPDMTDKDINTYFLERGYTRDVNISDASYDWRLGAGQLNERGYYSNLKQLVQRMYEDNSNTKVTLVVTSTGGPVSLYFLTQVVDQEWKDTYIHAYVSLAAPWAGLNINVLVSILTPPLNSTFFYPINAAREELRAIVRDFPSYYFLSLRPTSLSDNTVIVTTPSRNYTVNDYEQLYIDAGYPEGYSRYLAETTNEFPAPNVPTYCFYGLGIPTLETFNYGEGFPDTQPASISFGEGDGVVTRNSLEVCLRWTNSGYPFTATVFPGVRHGAIHTNQNVLESIGRVVGASRDPIDNGVAPIATTKHLSVVSIIATIFAILVAAKFCIDRTIL